MRREEDLILTKTTITVAEEGVGTTVHMTIEVAGVLAGQTCVPEVRRGERDAL